jgi:hypothetical protein
MQRKNKKREAVFAASLVFCFGLVVPIFIVVWDFTVDMPEHTITAYFSEAWGRPWSFPKRCGNPTPQRWIDPSVAPW